MLPSLTLFVALPLLIRAGLGFPASLCIALLIMIAAYVATATILHRFGVTL